MDRQTYENTVVVATIRNAALADQLMKMTATLRRIIATQTPIVVNTLGAVASEEMFSLLSAGETEEAVRYVQVHTGLPLDLAQELVAKWMEWYGE